MHGTQRRFLWLSAAFILGSVAPLSAQQADPVEVLREHAHALERADDIEPLVQRAKDRRLVLIGEASHGTREFYEWRAELTRRLIEEGRFGFIVVEGDWFAIQELDRYVRHHPEAAGSARAILEGFERWPRWLWANETVEDFVEWLRDHNLDRPEADRVALYGMDLNDPWATIDPLLHALERMNSPHLAEAREGMRCLERHDRDPGGFVAAVVDHEEDSCLDEVQDLSEALSSESDADPDDLELFHAAQNARVIANAMEHFLALALVGPASWNLRVDHFETTVEQVMQRHSGTGGVVWAHNTHVGDARASAMAVQGEESLGQRLREDLGDDDIYIVGFSSNRGRVLAGTAWNEGMSTMDVPPAARGSIDELLHRVGLETFLLFPPDEPLASALEQRRGQRAIGVVYDPDEDGQFNYVATDLPRRYDALIFIEETRPLEVIPGAMSEG